MVGGKSGHINYASYSLLVLCLVSLMILNLASILILCVQFITDIDSYCNLNHEVSRVNKVYQFSCSLRVSSALVSLKSEMSLSERKKGSTIITTNSLNQTSYSQSPLNQGEMAHVGVTSVPPPKLANNVLLSYCG